MKTTHNINGTVETNLHCEFCSKTFVREKSFIVHLCEKKERWIARDNAPNRIGFQTWVQFFSKTVASKKNQTYIDFIKSPYYTAFVRFANYCVEVNVINVPRFTDWLLSNNVKIDSWGTDSNYSKFLAEYIKSEDPMDAIYRSIEYCIELADEDKILPEHCLLFGNKNKLCRAIINGKLSPWLLYQSASGVEFLQKLDETQVKMVFDYIDPVQWAIKFTRDKESVMQISDILKKGGW